MSVSSSITSLPACERLDGIAADLEREVAARLHLVDRAIADARQLLEVASLLADAERGAALAAELERLDAERASLERAARLISERRTTATELSDAKPAPVAAVIAPSAANGAAPPLRPTRRPNGSISHAAATPPSSAPGELPAVAPAPPAAPRWTPRPKEVLEEEREGIETAVAAFSRPDPIDLARFKSQASRFRGAHEERKRHPGSQADWRVLEATLRDAQRVHWADQYCIPLDPKTLLPPDRWQQLARHYEDLAVAVAAMEWIEATVAGQPPHWLGREGAPLLEAIGATTSLLHRWLRRHLSWAHDNQQDDLFRRLRRLGEEHEQFIRSLQPEEFISDDELESLARDLPHRLEALQSIHCRKSAQERALSELSALIAEEGFGGGEGDDDRLCEAAARCLEAKIPATDRSLRERLLDLHWMLEGDPRLTRLHQAVLDEIERRRRKSEEEDTEAGRVDRLDDLTPDLRERLAALRSRTRGKIGVMIGGTCREDSRRAIQEALELSELRWPDSDPSDPFDRSAREIARADIIFLTRFNRQRSKEAIPLCRDQGKLLIRLPSGYGLNQVIAQAYQQLFGRV
jgi:hypothetical protein